MKTISMPLREYEKELEAKQNKGFSRGQESIIRIFHEYFEHGENARPIRNGLTGTEYDMFVDIKNALKKYHKTKDTE